MSSRVCRPIGAIAFLLAVTSVHAQTVTDGDTIRFGDKRVRLWGIDAPELHQACPDRWLAGIEAARKMRELVKGPHSDLREPRL